jgi:hypothetical protein
MPEAFLRSRGELVQVFPLISGQVNINAAAGAKYCTAFYCAIAGTFTVTFADAVGASIIMTAGQSFSIPNGGTVLATGGATFHFAKE